ncbi:hypothetical protein F4778DRAFT_9528 [Xylariomycetidae sp. FL2044]|nr:hypothetical protein F4778DRAFT_9528 [Xylariomycetidae sp. FL2044]
MFAPEHQANRIYLMVCLGQGARWPYYLRLWELSIKKSPNSTSKYSRGRHSHFAAGSSLQQVDVDRKKPHSSNEPQCKKRKTKEKMKRTSVGKEDLLYINCFFCLSFLFLGTCPAPSIPPLASPIFDRLVSVRQTSRAASRFDLSIELSCQPLLLIVTANCIAGAITESSYDDVTCSDRLSRGL